jgi:glycosyltransferase involved in cell wall biosynthesis
MGFARGSPVLMQGTPSKIRASQEDRLVDDNSMLGSQVERDLRHILILPSEEFVPPHAPLAGIFQLDQARALKDAGYRVGVVSVRFWHSIPTVVRATIDKILGLPCTDDLRKLSVGQLIQQGVKRIFEPYKFMFHENIEGIPVYRIECFSFLPRSMCSDWWSWCRGGMLAFKMYAEEEGRPDIIHAHNSLYAGLLAARIKARYGIPFVLTEHSSVYALNGYSRSLDTLIGTTLREADARLAVSSAMARLLQSRFGVGLHWETIPNVLGRVFAEHSSPPSARGHFSILNVASMERNKGQDTLLRAFARAFTDRGEVTLKLVGDGPMREELAALACQLGLANRVNFLGRLTRESVRREMLLSHVVVASSHYETFGVVLIEALACGRPVVATACGGPEDIVDRSNGLLVPPRDTEALAHALNLMYSSWNQYDPETLRRDCLARYGEVTFVKRLARVYEAILSKQAFL